MNLTLAIDGKLLERARKVAHHRRTTLNSMIRQLLEEAVGTQNGASLARELDTL